MLIAMIPGKQQALVGGGHIAAADHHPPENKDEHHRLQESLQQHGTKFAAGNVSIAPEQSQKSLPVQSRKAPSRVVQEKILELGSEMCTSHNSIEAPEARLAISETQRASAIGIHVCGVFILRVIVQRGALPHARQSLQALQQFRECRAKRSRSRKPPGTEAFSSAGVPKAMLRP